MKVLDNLLYTVTHEWVEMLEDGTALVGITDFAQHELGDLVYVNLPEVGDEVEAGKRFCDVESVKAVSDVYAPISGVILEVNEELMDAPEKLNTDPYGAWFVKLGEVSGKERLIDAETYRGQTE
jgi:glycine cleavage system H protein